jgi:hypothetical protein
MIARPLPAPEPQQRRPQVTTRRRARKTRLRMHVPVFAVLAFAVMILVPLLAYVAINANLTAQSFAIARVQREHAALLEETQRLDDRIAALHSPERLQALAAHLHMHDAHAFAVVTLPDPRPQPKASGFAFLPTWLNGR